MAWHGSKPLTLIGGKSRRQFCLRATLRARLPAPELRGSAKRTVDAYPVGSEHAVYYQPDDPTNAALEVGKATLPTNSNVVDYLGVGLDFLSSAGLVLRLDASSRRASCLWCATATAHM